MSLLKMNALLAAAGLALAAATGAAAQEFPEKPVTWVVPFSPGGSNDIVSRQIAKQLGEVWDEPVVIENRPGGGATIGSAHVAQQPADGYTIMIASVTFTMNAAVRDDLPYDPREDFTPITLIGQVPLVVGARPDMPADTPQEFFEYIRSGEDLSYGATGLGSIQHFAGELDQQLIGPQDLAFAIDHANPVAVAIESDAQFRTLRRDRCLKLLERFRQGRVRMVGREGAIDSGVQHLMLARKAGDDRFHCRPGCAVSAVPDDIEFAARFKVPNDPLDVGEVHIDSTFRPFPLREGAFRGDPSDLLDVVPEEWLLLKDHLEAIIVRRIMRAGNLDAAIHIEMVTGEIQHRSRRHAEAHDINAAVLQAFNDSVG